MSFNSFNHHRRSIRLKRYNYSSEGAYFVTICTRGREELFGDIAGGEMWINEYGAAAVTAWNILPERFPNVEIDAFVVMPNHIHGIILIHSPVGVIHELPLQKGAQPIDSENQTRRRRMLLPKVVGFFKMNSAKVINDLCNSHENPVWQRNYYERIIRNEAELARIRQYIYDNPINWGSDPDNVRVGAIHESPLRRVPVPRFYNP